MFNLDSGQCETVVDKFKNNLKILNTRFKGSIFVYI